MGDALGGFLRALHATPGAPAVAAGVPDAVAGAATHAREVARFRREVVPLLPAGRRPEAERLLSAVASASGAQLVHADLGPDHLLVEAGQLTGIIDWSDFAIGDPALDLAWGLHGSTPAFAARLAARYGVDDALAQRAKDWHRLGPWHEVTYGLDTGQPDLVASGLAGVLARLSL